MASRTFSRCDHEIWRALWRWTCRRHPTKGTRWIKQRYFQCVNGRDWRFSKPDKLLPILGEFRLRRPIKVLAEAHPYDPAFDEYFSKRRARKMEGVLEGRRTWRWLWGWQDGCGPVCDQRIPRDTGWQLHHAVKRSRGGSDKRTNLVLLHPNCHRQVHATE